MLNREHSQITYEDLRRFLEHLRLEYRRYTLGHVTSNARTIINVDADFGSKINVGDVITIDRNHNYSLATQSAIQIESPLLVVIHKISNTQLEVLSHGVASVTLQRLEDKSILYLGNDGRLTTTKEDNRINYAMGMYVDGLLLIYPRNLSNREKDFLVKVGLGNVDNTSDMNKPISNATRAEFDRVMSTIRLLDESLRRKLEEHIADQNVHVSDTDRNRWNSACETIQSHVANESIHTTNAERSKWNDMTPMEKFLEHINNTTIHHATGGYDQLDLRYAKKSDIPTIPTKVSAFENDAKYITKDDIPALDLTNYVKKTDLDTKLSDYLKKSDIDAKLANYQTKLNLSDFIKHSDIFGSYGNTTDIYTSYTGNDFILVDFTDKDKMSKALRDYHDESEYYFGINAAARYQIFKAFYVKIEPNGKILNIYNEASDVPLNSITVLTRRLTENGVENGTFGILVRNKNGKYFIGNNRITTVPSTPPTPTPSVGIATETKAGIVRPDNTTITVDSTGMITAHTTHTIATTDKIGSVKPDGDTILIDSNGTISVHNQINKLVQLSDVYIDNLQHCAGQVLTVNPGGTGFILSNPPSPTNEHFEKVIQSPDGYEFVYDFSTHINHGISATLDITNLNATSDAKIKFIGRNGGELIEPIKGSYHLTIPEREFHVNISIQGNVKVMIDVLALN